MPIANKPAFFRAEALKYKDQRHDGSPLIAGPVSAFYIVLLCVAVACIAIFVLSTMTPNGSEVTHLYHPFNDTAFLSQGVA